jgi:hypothetical protein
MNPDNPQPVTQAPELTNIVLDVLGELAFMITDDVSPELPTGTVWMAAEVEYEGPVRGVLHAWCTRTLAIRLAANLLGIEPEEGGAQVAAEDALREFMNVLCGQLVTNWHGNQAVFNLSIPVVRECLGPPTLPQEGHPQASRLTIDGEPLLCLYARVS